MKAKSVNLFWGLILILGGGLFLADNLGYLNLDSLTPYVWSVIFGAASLLFLALYLVSGVQKWGLLFPASISAGVALTIYMANATNADAAVGAPVLISVAVPFAVAFLLDARRNWWALIPTWVMVVITLITLVVDHVSGEAIGSLFMFAVALPFAGVYLANRTRRWALIPAFVISAIAVIPLLANRATGELIGAYVTMMIALPFFIVYLWSPKNWWALIPAGFMGTIAIGLLVFLPGPGEIEHPEWMAALLFLGWALTFGALWLRRRSQPTEWAGYPALGFALSSPLVFFLGDNFELVWPIIIIALGIMVLFGSLRKHSPLA